MTTMAFIHTHTTKMMTLVIIITCHEIHFISRFWGLEWEKDARRGCWMGRGWYKLI